MASWLNLEGKVFVVTGGASGIGHAIAQELLDNGASVAVCDHSALEPVFENSENKYKFIKADITNKDHVEEMITSIIDKFGTIDGIVNNAGINIPRLLIDSKHHYELDEEVWDRVMDVNVKGLFFCTQAAAREMIKNKNGVIINISSESGLEGSEGQSVYAASKNAVNSLTRSWGKELGKQGVRVVGVAPGIMEETGLRTIEYESALAYTRNLSVEQLRANYSNTSTIPLGRSGRLSEVANIVAFLLSDRASYVHGVTINVAGGKTRG